MLIATKLFSFIYWASCLPLQLGTITYQLQYTTEFEAPSWHLPVPQLYLFSAQLSHTHPANGSISEALLPNCTVTEPSLFKMFDSSSLNSTVSALRK